MSDFDYSFSMELKYPLDEETLDILTDAELNNTNRIWFVTKSGKKVSFVKVEALDKAKAVIEEHIKINQNLKPNDTKVMRWCLDVIDKYTAESEGKE